MVDKNMSNEDTKTQETPEIKCPGCGNTDHSHMVFVENVLSLRSVFGFNEEGTLLVSGDSHESEDGENPRLQCTKCYGEFPLPKKIQFGEG